MPPLQPSQTKIGRDAARSEVELRRSVGADIRRQREDAGISIRTLASASGISHGLLWAIESGDVSPSFEVLARISGALGCRATIRFHPNTGPLVRDHLQAPMLQALLAVAHRRWRRLLDVPVYRPVRGSIDLVLDDPTEPMTIAGEAQSQLRRIEQQLRWATMKADALAEGGARELIALAGRPQAVSRLLILRVTSTTLHVGRAYDQLLRAAYPARYTEAVAALTGSAPWPGPALVWMDVANGRASLRDAPPRGIAVGR